MDSLPFSNLKPHRNRCFVPETLQFGEWEQIAPLFDRLESSLQLCQSVQALEKWLLDWGELSAALDEESSRRYIAMTCNTESHDAEKAFLHFVEAIEPNLKPRNFKLSRMYMDHPVRKELSADRYRVMDRTIALQVELFREENVALETEESKLCQQYQKLSGSLTVQFNGEERTLVQMSRFLEEPDRNLRQQAWELVAKRRLQEQDKFDEQFEQLLAVREQIAKNAGFSDYLSYAFRARGRFDYTVEDCLRFHEAIEQEVVPVLKALQEERKQALGLSSVRPWDLAVDPLNRPPLRPFEKVEQMVQSTQSVFEKLDSELAAGFKLMQDLKLLDLANRKGKAPGGYQSTLSEARLPFIFMNAVGVQRDLETILHEAGHAFHALATREEDLYTYRNPPIEFCEVASMSMELLGNDYIESFYPAAEGRRAKRDHLEGIIEVFPWIATVDAFQHWIYSHPGHTRTERRAAWLSLMDRFGGIVDWSGYEDARAALWHRQLHIFIHPFYYVEYGIAQLGALQVWLNSKSDRKKALREYKAGLALGGSKPLPELFAAAGCRFDFSRETVQPAVALVREELSKLS